MTTTARRVILTHYRTGTEAAADLTTLDKIDLPDPGAGEVLVRTTHLTRPRSWPT